PVRERRGVAAPRDGRVDRRLLAREHAGRDRGLRVAVASGEVTPAGGVDRDRLARLRALEARGDRAREDPRMTAAHRALAPRLEREAPHLGALAAADERARAAARLAHQADRAERHLAIDRLAHVVA